MSVAEQTETMNLPVTSFSLANTKHCGEEGLVILGCSGKIDEWKQQLIDDLNEKKVGKGKYLDFFKEEVVLLETTGGRHDLVFFFCENTKLDIGRLAMWRLRMGSEASWWSDYTTNYGKQHFISS